MSDLVENMALLRDANADAMRLAELSSLASRVEPELLRALRLELLQGADVAAESDLWWSALVETRSPTAIRLARSALPQLRGALVKRRSGDGARDDSSLDAAYAVLSRLHAGAPEVTRIEEALTYECLRGNLDAARDKLLEVLGRLLTPERCGEFTSWALGALPRLPEQAHQLESFWTVLFAANAQGLGSAAVATEAVTEKALLGAQRVPTTLLARAELVNLEVALENGYLSLRVGEQILEPGNEPTAWRRARQTFPGLFVPRLQQVLVEIVETPARGPGAAEAVGVRRSVVEVSTETWTQVTVGTGALELRAIDGRTYGLERVSQSVSAEELPWGNVVELAKAVDGETIAMGVLTGPRTVITAARVGEVGDPIAVRRGPSVMRGELYARTHQYGPALIRLDEPLECSPLPARVHDLDRASTFVALGPDRAVTQGHVFGLENGAGSLTFDEGYAEATLGAPVFSEGQLLGQVLALGHDDETAERIGMFRTSDRITKDLAAWRDYEAAFDAADELQALVRSEAPRAEFDQLRAEMFSAELVPRLDESGVRLFWEKDHGGRRWVALVHIARQKLRSCADIVETALARPRGWYEAEEAERAARALGLNAMGQDSAAPAHAKTEGSRTSISMPRSTQRWLRFLPTPPLLAPHERWHVYVAHRASDRPWVLALRQVLQTAGFRVFTSQQEGSPGSSSEGQLTAAIETSRSAALIWSSRSADSAWLMREFEELRRRRETSRDFQLVVVKLGSTELPFGLSQEPCIDFSNSTSGPTGINLIRLVSVTLGIDVPSAALEADHHLTEQKTIAERRIRAAKEVGSVDRLKQYASEAGDAWFESPDLFCAAARALIDLRSYDHALEVLDHMGEFSDASSAVQLRALAFARKARDMSSAAANESSDQNRAAGMAAAESMLEHAQFLLAELVEQGHSDAETLGIYARTWMDRYELDGKRIYLEKSRDLYARAFEANPADFYTGINAATKSVLLGERERGAELADKVLAVTGREPVASDYWKNATIGEVLLVKGDYSASAAMYRRAVVDSPSQVASHEATRRSAKLLLEALNPPTSASAAILAAFELDSKTA